jgi:hypothetical protein
MDATRVKNEGIKLITIVVLVKERKAMIRMNRGRPPGSYFLAKMPW